MFGHGKLHRLGGRRSAIVSRLAGRPTAAIWTREKC